MRSDLFDTLRISLTNKLHRKYPRASRHDIEDAVASAIEHYLTSAPEHVRTCERKSKAWLFTTAWRSLRQSHERLRRHSSIDETLVADQSITVSADHLTSQLTSRARVIVWLHSVEGLRPREIAESLGCSVNAVNLHLKRAYRELRRSLQRDYSVLLESYHYWLSTFKLSYASEWATSVPLI